MNLGKYPYRTSFRIVNPASTVQPIRLFGANLLNPYAAVPNWQVAYTSLASDIEGIIYNGSTDRLYAALSNGSTNRLYAALSNGAGQQAVSLQNIKGSAIVEDIYDHSDIYDTEQIATSTTSLLYYRRALATGDWYVLVIDSGTEQNIGVLPANVATANINPAAVKFAENALYRVSYSPSTGQRATTVKATGEVYIDTVGTGFGSITQDADGVIYMNDRDNIYRLDTIGSQAYIAKDGQQFFAQFAQMPALCSKIKIFASDIQQFAQRMDYGSRENNFEKNIFLFPLNGFSSNSGTIVAESSFEQGQGLLISGDTFIDHDLLPNSTITITFETERVNNGLQSSIYR